MWPSVIVDNFFTLVNQCLSHAQQLLPRQLVMSIVNRAGLVLDAGHLE